MITPVRNVSYMNRAASAYICFGVAIILIGVVYAYYIVGPSRFLFILLGTALIITGVRSKDKDDNPAESRDYFTLVSALAPGLIHLTTIYKKTQAPKDLMTGMALAMGFFGSLIFIGFIIVASVTELPHIGNPLPIIALCFVLIFGCCDVSITLVNGYCDREDMPYTDGRFENHHENPGKDAIKSAIATIILAIVLSFFMKILVQIDQESLSEFLIQYCVQPFVVISIT